MMKDIIVTWLSNKFTEDEICAAFSLTHKEFRDLLAKHSIDMPKHYSKGLEAEIASHWDLSVEELLTRYKLTRNHLLNFYFKKKPFNVRDKGRQIQTLLAKGLSAQDIADELDCTTTYVYSLKPDDQKRRKALTEEEWELAKKALTSNSVTAVAKQLNTSRSAIYYRLKKDAEIH